MSLSPSLLYALQAALVLAGVFMVWSGWTIRTQHRHELMRTIGTRVLEKPALIEKEFAIYQTVFGAALMMVVALWIGFEWSLGTATIVTTAVTVLGTGWRSALLRLHDQRRG